VQELLLAVHALERNESIDYVVCVVFLVLVDVVEFFKCLVLYFIDFLQEEQALLLLFHFINFLFQLFLLLQQLCHPLVELQVSVVSEAEVDIEYQIAVGIRCAVGVDAVLVQDLLVCCWVDFEPVNAGPFLVGVFWLDSEDVLSPGPVEGSKCFVLIFVWSLLDHHGEVLWVYLCLVDHFTYSLFKRCHSQQSEPEHEADSKIACNDNDGNILLRN